MRPLDNLLGPAIDCAVLTDPRAVEVARLVNDRLVQGFAFIEARRDGVGQETVIVNVHVDRPTISVHPLRAVEPLAMTFVEDGQPRVLALRDAFPETAHQNVGHAGDPISLCIDDRPWVEARLAWTPVEFLVRIQAWLAKTARGELHGPARVPDPVYVHLGPSVVLSREALQQAFAGAVPLTVHRAPDGDRAVLIADTGPVPAGRVAEPMIMFAVMANARPMGRLRHPPRTFDELADEVETLGLDLRREACGRIASCVGAAWTSGNSRTSSTIDPPILTASLGIIVIFPIQDEGTTTAGAFDVRGFITVGSMLDLGVGLGCVARSPDGVHARILGPIEPARSTRVEVKTSLVHIAHDREVGALLSGAERVGTTRVVLVGAGAIGSHVATMLAREGLFQWTVIDPDVLLPHNVVRHTLPPGRVGTAKAIGVADQIREVLSETESAVAIVADVMDGRNEHAPLIRVAMRSSEVILDASASVAAGRYVSDLPETIARRVSFFFNPDGTDAVILAEPAVRGVTLRQIEAQYYRMIVDTPDLAGHLISREGRILYAGACRQVTNRMPESRVAYLSAAVAGELPRVLDAEEGQVIVFRRDARGMQTLRSTAHPWHAARFGAWVIMVSGDLSTELRGRRALALPAETGGILLGTVDTAAKVIHICMTLASPPDSVGSSTGFERGISGLRSRIATIASETSGQMSYVGEWHSHPAGSATTPSVTDLLQVADLATFLDLSRTPALMVIVGDQGWRLVAADLDGKGSLTLVSEIVDAAPLPFPRQVGADRR